MINCSHYRRSILTDPNDSNPELQAHRAGCDECNDYAARVLPFESRLARALRVDIPGVADRLVPLRARALPTAASGAAKYRNRWLAMAASVSFAVVLAGALWLSVPGPTLAADVVTHMAEEPGAWRTTEIPVPSPALQKVLSDSHVSLAAAAGMVSYANSCGFRGHKVPHLVIQTAAGPVTVMVLAHETVSKAVQFDEGGYRGVIVPVPGHGSLAVLARGANADIKAVDAVATHVRDSIVWTG